MTNKSPADEERERRAEALEALVELYLRLNGYFCIRNYLQHKVDDFGLETESDVVAMRMPYQREEFLDGRVQPNDPKLILPPSSGMADCIFAEVKEPAVEFNRPVRGPDGPRRIRNVLRMFGVFPDAMFEREAKAWSVAEELHRKINELRWPAIPTAVLNDERIAVRMIVFAPQSAEHASDRAFFDLQRALDFVRGRMAPGEPCSPYRGPGFSPWRGTTRLIVDALDAAYYRGASSCALEELLR